MIYFWADNDGSLRCFDHKYIEFRDRDKGHGLPEAPAQLSGGLSVESPPEL